MNRSFAVWVNPGFSGRLVLKRSLVFFCLGVVPAAITCALGHGLFGFGFVVVGAWPLPFRLSVDAAGVMCRWWFVRETIPLSDIVSARIVLDPRRWAFFRRAVLELRRLNGPSRLVFATPATLAAFEAEIRRIMTTSHV